MYQSRSFQGSKKSLGAINSYEGLTGWFDIVGSAFKVVSNIVSGGGRGDFKKFDREIKPILLSKAQQTGCSAVAYWFGDVVAVYPNGMRLVLYHYGSDINDGYRWAQQFAATYDQTIYSYQDGKWYVYGPTGVVTPSDIATVSAQGATAKSTISSTSMLPLLIGGGAVAYLIFAKGKKRG